MLSFGSHFDASLVQHTPPQSLFYTGGPSGNGPSRPTQSPDEDDDVEAVVRVYRAALDGADFRALPEWAALDGMNTTTGHYFRGVE